MAVPSTITDLSDTAASNFPQDSDSTGSTVASLPRAISSIIKKMVIRGSDITVIGSGSVTIPSENNYFVVNGTGFTVSGFSAVFNGRMVTLEFTGALTLTNSASFILFGSNITTTSGDVMIFVNETGSTWRLVSYNKFTGGTATNQIISTLPNNVADGGGQLYLNGATGNRIDFNVNGINPPSFTTRSTGTKLVLYPFVSASTTDFALGLDLDVFWSSVPSSTQSFKWYAATTNIATLTGAGIFSTNGLRSVSDTIGYSTGAGGTVTQATSKSTGVTLNKPSGLITMNAASLAGGATVVFILTNSFISATDNVIVNTNISGGGNYHVEVFSISAGACSIYLTNNTGVALAQAVPIRFCVIKGSDS